MLQTIKVLALFAIAALLAVLVYLNWRKHHHPLLTTPFQSVQLRSGEVYYGRLDHLGTDHPVLRQALKLRVVRDGSGGPANVTVQWLRDEADGADHLIFTAYAIDIVRPVDPRSAVGLAIAQAAAARAGP